MRALRLTLAFCVLSVPRASFAADPLNSSNRAAAGGADAASTARTEVNAVPVAGGTTDIGFGVGEFSGLTRVKPGADPYVWNLSSAGLVTFKPSPDGAIKLPYQDLWIRLTIPRVLNRGARLEVRPSYTWESTLGYYGIGNATTDRRPAGTDDSYFWYERLHPSINVTLWWRILDHLAAMSSVRYTLNFIRVPDGTKLAQDLRTASDEVKSLLGPTDPHSVLLFSYGLQWDDRDSEVSPRTGSFVEAVVRLSPGGIRPFPRRYGQAGVAYRRFIPLGSKRTVLALRGVADLLFGAPPFYELARFNDTYAIGGSEGVRGVPAQRYYGKVKAFGNVEVRQDVASFQWLGKPMDLALAAFFDGGRVWAEPQAHPELDGTGIGLKYGVGGGLRLQSGVAFVLRADVAWSPDARPLGAYFAAGQEF